MDSQNKMLKKYMMTHKGGITAKEAWMYLSIQRLSARIADLIREGVDIASEYETGENKYGEKVRYKRYWMRET